MPSTYSSDVATSGGTHHRLVASALHASCRKVVGSQDRINMERWPLSGSVCIETLANSFQVLTQNKKGQRGSGESASCAFWTK